MKNISSRNIGGFTLIELLVVVLIIGILSAVALPMYQKTVEKAKGVQAITLVRSLYQAQEAYRMANGTYSEKLENLDIEFPRTEKQENSVPGRNDDFLSNGEWDVSINSDSPLENTSCVDRLTGNYKGSGFCIQAGSLPNSASKEWRLGELVCREVVGSYTGTPGSYCQKIFNGKLVYTGSARVYAIAQY